jgi:adenylate cyclase
MQAAFGGVAAEEQARKATSAAERALALDASLFEAHVTLGFIQALHQYDWAGAENHFQYALDLNRDDARAHLFYAGTVLSAMGRLREADFHQQRAAELDPMSPVVIGGWGADWLFQRQYDNAISACQRSLELDPTYPWALRWLGEAYLLKGMHKEAVSTLNKIGTPVFGCGLLGWSYLKSGCPDRATQLLLDLQKQASPALACQRAILNLAFGHEEETFKQLWQACVARNVGVHWLKVDPIWDPLRSNPEFQEILHRMNLVLVAH